MLRYGVETTVMPWVAFAQTPQSQPYALKGTMFGEGIYGVVGAGGLETAVMAQPGTQ